MGKGGFKGEYHAPAHSSSTVRGSYTSTDSSGVGDGLSARRDLETEMLYDFTINNEVGPSGNPRSCIEPRGSKSVKSKGHSFTIC